LSGWFVNAVFRYAHALWTAHTTARSFSYPWAMGIVRCLLGALAF